MVPRRNGVVYFALSAPASGILITQHTRISCLSPASHQYVSFRTNQHASHQYVSFRTNQHQSSATSLPNIANVVQHTTGVNAEKRYFDMEITIRPYVNFTRDSIEQLRTLLATHGFDDEDHGYTHRIMMYAEDKAAKVLLKILIERNGNLCTCLGVIQEGVVPHNKIPESMCALAYQQLESVIEQYFSVTINQLVEYSATFFFENEEFKCALLNERKRNATTSSGDGRMVLPRQCIGQPPRWLHIKMVEEVTGSWMIAVMRSDNMYWKGIINMDWSCFELRENNPDRKLPPEYNAIDAGCSVTYHSMIGCSFEDVKQILMKENLGFGSAVRSVQILSKSTCFPLDPARVNSKDNPGTALASLIFSVSELTRMNVRYSGLGAENNGLYWSIGPELTRQLWDLAQNWRYMSYTALDCRDTGYLKFTPNKYLDSIGKNTLQLTVEPLSMVLDSPEWYYEMDGPNKPTRMDLVLDPDNKKRQFKQLVMKKKNGLMVMGPSSLKTTPPCPLQLISRLTQSMCSTFPSQQISQSE